LQGDGESVVARTRPAREAASKPKTYVEDSDGLDEEEDEDDAFVGGGGTMRRGRRRRRRTCR